LKVVVAMKKISRITMMSMSDTMGIIGTGRRRGRRFMAGARARGSGGRTLHLEVLVKMLDGLLHDGLDTHGEGIKTAQ
jgi:hypothetical protein